MGAVKQHTTIILLLLLMALQGYGQIDPYPSAVVPDPLPGIVEIEYFFDTDPGYGNGTAVAITPADSLISKEFDVDISGLDAGRHLLYLRTLDENGLWTLAYVTEFNKAASQPPPMEALADIVAMEYFFDTDPGYGNGTAVPIIPTDSLISKEFDVDISGLDAGRHLLYFRTLDEDGNWTLAYVTLFNKAASFPPHQLAALPEIVEIEYFFDTDPGFGKGTAVPPSQVDSLISDTFNVDISGLEMGRHLLYLRTLDEDGNWTLAYVTEFVKAASPPPMEALPDIVAMEYFFDTDPGFGKGTLMPIIPTDSLISEAFDVDVSGIGLGRHLLYIRTLDEDGNWTLAHVTLFNKVASPTLAGPRPDIVAMEYFIDTDPGFGNATPIVMTADSLVEASFDIDVSSWGTEVHILYVRALDELGSWTLVYLEPLTRGVVNRRMRHGKFFFNGIEQPMFTEDIPD